MSTSFSTGAATPIEVVLRFTAGNQLQNPQSDLQSLLVLFAEQSGCSSVRLGRATENTQDWLVSSSWESVGAYRRALSSYDIKVAATHILSAAVDESSAYEILSETDGGVVRHYSSALSLPEDDRRNA